MCVVCKQDDAAAALALLDDDEGGGGGGDDDDDDDEAAALALLEEDDDEPVSSCLGPCVLQRVAMACLWCAHTLLHMPPARDARFLRLQ